MAYQVIERTPKGYAKTYVDTSTGEIISKYEERKRLKQEARSHGFLRYVDQQKALKVNETKIYQKAKTKHTQYKMEGVFNLKRATEFIDSQTKNNADRVLVRFNANGKMATTESIEKGNNGFIANTVGELENIYENDDASDIEDEEYIPEDDDYNMDYASNYLYEYEEDI